MTICATDNDLVIGMCTHMELVPTPGGPVPTPIPHPFVSMISDPSRKAANAVVGPLKQAAGAPPSPDRPMKLAGLPVTNVGTVIKNATMLPHIPLPPGTGWAPMPKPPLVPVGILEAPPPPAPPPMPAGDALLGKGSGKVKFGKGEVVRLGDTADSCSEPSRQTSTVLAVPKGGPVCVGG
jgi:hypothetical protein